MQKVPVVTAQVVAVAGIEPIEAMHRVTNAVKMPAVAKSGAAAINAADDAATDASGPHMLTGSDAFNVRAAEPADMTDPCTDVSGAKTSDRANAADMRTAAKATHVTAAKATAYTAAVAATAESAAAAAARFCLYRKQARRQQRGRQNGHHLSHHCLHRLWNGARRPQALRHRRFR
jgi:hypothetical protein